MNKLLSLIFSFLLLTLMFIPVYADTDFVVDNADILSAYEEAELETKLREASKRLSADIVVLTEETIDSSAGSYADDYYDYNGYAEDGIILLVSVYDREWHVSTAGVCIEGFNDDALDYLCDDIPDELGEEQYVKCFDRFADRSEEIITLIRDGKSFKVPFNFLMTLVVCIVIGFVAALIVTLIMKSKLKSVVARSGAADYLKKDSLNITVSRDIFLYRQVTRTQKAESSSGSHTSSSGSSHGGRGGSF